jgi:hypothetical protein
MAAVAGAFAAWSSTALEKKRERHKLRTIMMRFTNACIMAAWVRDLHEEHTLNALVACVTNCGSRVSGRVVPLVWTRTRGVRWLLR